MSGGRHRRRRAGYFYRPRHAAAPEIRGQAVAAAAAASLVLAPSVPAYASEGRTHPLPDGTLTSEFGPRGGRMHKGIDLGAPIGTPIYAPAAGEVIDTGEASGFGLWVRIRHDDGTETRYGHIHRDHVSVGDRVEAGDLIAEVGNRGRSTGPHLHFEVYEGGEAINPAGWLEAAEAPEHEHEHDEPEPKPAPKPKPEPKPEPDEKDATPARRGKLSEAEIADLMREVGFPESEIGTGIAVARGESGHRTDALNDGNSDGSNDYGLWQINDRWHMDKFDGDWRDPLENTRVAYEVWKEAGGSWDPWVAYDESMDDAPAPPSTPSEAPEAPEEAPAETDRAPGAVHIVRPGDALSELAAAHGTTWQHLHEMNPGIGDPHVIHPGDRIDVTGHPEVSGAPNGAPR